MPSIPPLSGRETYRSPELPKSRGVKGYEFIMMQPPYTTTSPSTSSPQILPLHFIHRNLHDGRVIQKKGHKNDQGGINK